MDFKSRMLERLYDESRSNSLDDAGELQWRVTQLMRNCAVRAGRGDPSGWDDFIAHLSRDTDVADWVFRLFRTLEWASYSVENDCVELTLPVDWLPIASDVSKELVNFLNPSFDGQDAMPDTRKPGGVMYIEEKPGLTGHARIGRVTFSATRKTIYYGDRKLKSLKGAGYKANYYDVDSGEEYWVSNCKKDGSDTLYPGIVAIDEDAREEYWTAIRDLPENIGLTSFRSPGKHSKRRPS